MSIRSHKDLRVWQKSMDLAEQDYKATVAMPKTEAYGLTSQLRRAAVSVPANIAEGYGRNSTRSYAHFLKTARGSLLELETQLILAQRVGVQNVNQVGPLTNETDSIGKMLSGLIKSVERQSNNNAFSDEPRQ